MSSLEAYKVLITYYSGEQHILEVKTPDISWSMNQYQRNRAFFTWEVIEDETNNDSEDVQLEKDIKNGLYGEEY